MRTLNSNIDSVTITGTFVVSNGLNITQFGGNNVVTGIGASGNGIPRVTVSNDSNILATQSGTWNIGTLTSITNAVNTNADQTVSNGTVASKSFLIGGTFNTTQPTLLTGQGSALQSTNRGALIVGTGVDTFNTTINTALPTGANTIGAVTQASGPWTSNITQFGGTNLSTGTGAGGVGIPRVTVSNDSNVLSTQSGNWTTRVVGNSGGIVDFVGQNATQPANSLLIGGEFNTTPTTIISGNASPIQLDSSANLLVNLKTALPTGTNSIGTIQPGNTANTTPWLMKINDGVNSATVTTESLKVDLNRINGKTLNTYSTRITTATTVTPVASTAYIASIAITTEVAGAGSTITIRDKQGTPLVLVNALSGAVVTASPVTFSFTNAPIQMVNGIDVITTSATPATWDLWITYF